jgi:hypothetical protein
MAIESGEELAQRFVAVLQGRLHIPGRERFHAPIGMDIWFKLFHS